MSSSELRQPAPVAAADVDGLCAHLESLVAADPGAVGDEQRRRLFTAAFRLFAASAVEGAAGEPFTDGAPVTATDVVVVVSMLLAQQNLEVFELALWQNFGGQPWVAR